MDLAEINQVCKDKLSKLENYELIEKVLFSQDETIEIGKKLSHISSYMTWGQVYDLKETITIFLVGIAKYFYNDKEGGFWQAVERLTNISQPNKRELLVKAFDRTVSLYNLNSFKNLKEVSYKNLAPIIAHSGLPNNLINNFLDNLAPLLSQEISYNDLADETLYTFRYSTKNVKRYVDLLNENGLLGDFVFEIIGAIKEKIENIDETSILPIPFQEGIINWCKNKEDNDKRYISSRYKKPTLRFDINSNKVVIDTPEMTMNDSTFCIWEIYSDDKVVQRKIYGEKLNDEYFFRTSTIILNQFDEIKIKLLNDINTLLCDYTLKDKDDKFLTFNNFGQLNKSKFILNNGTYILLDENYEADDDTIELIDNYNGYNIYYQAPTTDKREVIFKSDVDTISIKIKRPFELINENKLISDNCYFEGLEAFSCLPKIKVPFNGQWQVKISVDENKIIDEEVFIEDFVFDMSDYIGKISFGKIGLRFYFPEIGYKTFKFLYLPEANIDFSQYYPRISGYKNSYIVFKSSDKCKILDSNHETVNRVDILSSCDIFNGYYVYNEKEYKFKFVIKPYKWTIESNNKLFGQPNKKAFLSVKDLKTDGDCLLSITNNTNSDIYVKFNNNVGQKPLRIRKSSKAIINLVEYIEFISSGEDSCLIILEENFDKICEICEIRINISVRNFFVNKLGDTFIFQWDEDGSCKNRQMVFRYLSKPYEFFSIPIKDNTLMAYIDDNDERLIDNCVVEIVSNKEKSIFSTNEKKDLIDSKNTTVLWVKDNDFSQLVFHNNNIDDLKNAIYCYLFYRFNTNFFQSKEEYLKVVKYLMKYIFNNRFNFGDEIILKLLFEYDLSKEQFDKIANELVLYFPITKKENQIDRDVLIELLDYNKYLYFVYVCLKNNVELLEEITNNNLKFLDNFTDKENFLWAKKYYLFPEVDKVDYIQQKMKMLKAFSEFSKYKEEKQILMIIVDLILNQHDIQNNIPLLVTISKYIKNLLKDFPKALLSEILNQSSHKKEI